MVVVIRGCNGCVVCGHEYYGAVVVIDMIVVVVGKHVYDLFFYTESVGKQENVLMGTAVYPVTSPYALFRFWYDHGRCSCIET